MDDVEELDEGLVARLWNIVAYYDGHGGFDAALGEDDRNAIEEAAKALTVSPEKMAKATEAVLFRTRQKHGKGYSYISADQASNAARAAAIALGLKVEG